jgi:UDP-glucose 4-epimerase
MKRVLITGAGGFVGANLTRRLVEGGHEVHVLVQGPAAPWRLDDIKTSVQLHCGDVAARDDVRRIMAGIRPAWVFHLAAYGAYSWQTDADRMLRTNVQGCMCLLDACAEAGSESFVQAGSSSEYGLKDHPAQEDETLQPNSVYAVTKAAATHCCQLQARQRDLHAVTARLYSIYGPFEEPRRLIPALLLYGMRREFPPLAQPGVARDFVYVDDAVDALLALAAARDLPRGSVYNVCSGVQSTLADVVGFVQAMLDVSGEPRWASMEARSWDTNIWVGCPSAMLQHVGWRATTNLRSGLERTLAWFREHPARARFYSSRIFDK